MWMVKEENNTANWFGSRRTLLIKVSDTAGAQTYDVPHDTGVLPKIRPTSHELVHLDNILDVNSLFYYTVIVIAFQVNRRSSSIILIVQNFGITGDTAVLFKVRKDKKRCSVPRMSIFSVDLSWKKTPPWHFLSPALAAFDQPMGIYCIFWGCWLLSGKRFPEILRKYFS